MKAHLFGKESLLISSEKDFWDLDLNSPRRQDLAIILGNLDPASFLFTWVIYQLDGCLVPEPMVPKQTMQP